MERGGGESVKAAVVCGEEAMNLLNCVVQSPYDPDKCVLLLSKLRQCVLAKKVKKFSLDGDHQQGENPEPKKA